MTLSYFLMEKIVQYGESKTEEGWPCGLMCRSAAPSLVGVGWWGEGVRMPPGAWIFVSCECCMVSGRGFYEWLITHPEESYRMCVTECDQAQQLTSTATVSGQERSD